MNDEHDRKAKEQAQRDLDAISVLKKSEHFNGYFLRRVGDRIRSLEHKLKYDTDTALTSEGTTREAIRQAIIALESLPKILVDDERTARTLVEGPNYRRTLPTP